MDAVRYLLQTDDGKLADVPATHDFLKKLRRQLSDYPNAVYVAEAWTETSVVARYYGNKGNVFPLAFSFDLAGAIKSSVKDGNRANLNQALRTSRRHITDRGFEAPFLSNHDMRRVMRELGDDPAGMRLAAATLMAMPGTPFLYYGEEIGMRGGPSSRDEDKRTPMIWHGSGPGYGFSDASRLWHPTSEPEGVNVAAQRGQPGSLWTLYRDLIALRHAEPALADGTSAQPTVTDAGRGVTCILRTEGNERVLFVANFHREAAAAFTVGVEGAPAVLMESGLVDLPRLSQEKLRFSGLGPQGFAFIRLTP